MNFRMTELSGAVLLAQVRKLDLIRTHLRANKKIVKAAIAGLPGLAFRTIVDAEGDLATHLVVMFPSAEVARKIAKELGSITLDASGWHVYATWSTCSSDVPSAARAVRSTARATARVRRRTSAACCREPTPCSRAP